MNPVNSLIIDVLCESFSPKKFFQVYLIKRRMHFGDEINSVYLSLRNQKIILHVLYE